MDVYELIARDLAEALEDVEALEADLTATLDDAPLPADRPRPFVPCHPGVRASRLAASIADLAAHPEIFRCPCCGLMLDAPSFTPKVNDRAAAPILARTRAAAQEETL